MFKVLLTLFVIFSLFKVSFALAGQCTSLFANIQTPSDQVKFVRETFDKVYFNTDLIDKIEQIKLHTENTRESKMDASRAYAELLEPLYNLFAGKGYGEPVPHIVRMGVGNLTLDLLDPSSKSVSTRRILNENFAITNYVLANESLNSQRIRDTSKVVSVSANLTNANGEVVEARRKIFSLIDSYLHESSLPAEVKTLRIEVLLESDQRFRSLGAKERFEFLNRFVNSLENIEGFIGSELLLSRHFK